MAKKFEVEGNYLVVSDTGTSNIDLEAATKDLRYSFTNGTVRFYLPDSSKRFAFSDFDFNLLTSTGSVELTGGASGSVDGITVNAIEVMSGAETFDTDLDTTAGNVAANITAYTSAPNYTAVAVGAVITITPVVGDINTDAVVSSTTTITSTDTNFSGGSSDIEDNTDTDYANEAALITFLRTNTGA